MPIAYVHAVSARTSPLHDIPVFGFLALPVACGAAVFRRGWIYCILLYFIFIYYTYFVLFFFWRCQVLAALPSRRVLRPCRTIFPCLVDSAGAAGFSSAARIPGFPALLEFLALPVAYGDAVPASTSPLSHDIPGFRGQFRRCQLVGWLVCLFVCLFCVIYSLYIHFTALLDFIALPVAYGVAVSASAPLVLSCRYLQK